MEVHPILAVAISAQLHFITDPKSEEIPCIRTMRSMTTDAGKKLPWARWVYALSRRMSFPRLGSGEHMGFGCFFAMTGRAEVPNALTRPGGIWTSMRIMTQDAISGFDRSMPVGSYRSRPMALLTCFMDSQ